MNKFGPAAALISGLFLALLSFTSAEARYFQVDPTGYQNGMNLYAYVGNDPVNNTDPSGKSGIGCAIGAAVTIETGPGAIGGCAAGEGIEDIIEGAAVTTAAVETTAAITETAVAASEAAASGSTITVGNAAINPATGEITNLALQSARAGVGIANPFELSLSAQLAEGSAAANATVPSLTLGSATSAASLATGTQATIQVVNNVLCGEEEGCPNGFEPNLGTISTSTAANSSGSNSPAIPFSLGNAGLPESSINLQNGAPPK